MDVHDDSIVLDEDGKCLASFSPSRVRRSTYLVLNQRILARDVSLVRREGSQRCLARCPCSSHSSGSPSFQCSSRLTGTSVARTGRVEMIFWRLAVVERERMAEVEDSADDGEWHQLSVLVSRSSGAGDGWSGEGTDWVRGVRLLGAFRLTS